MSTLIPKVSKHSNNSLIFPVTNSLGVWGFNEGPGPFSIVGDKGLVMTSKGHRHAISTRLPKTIDFNELNSFALSFDVRFGNGITCGGGYIKLLTQADDLTKFNGETPFAIMYVEAQTTNGVKLIIFLTFYVILQVWPRQVWCKK